MFKQQGDYRMQIIGGEAVRGSGGNTERLNFLTTVEDRDRIDAFAKDNNLSGRGSALRALTRIGLEAFENSREATNEGQ